MTTPYYSDERVTLYHGDCLDVLRGLPDASVDAIVTDPPYGLEFMGKDWDRPWAVTASAGVGFKGREDNLTLPSHRDGRNANCRTCGGRQRGANRCTCDSPSWDRHPREDMVAFQQWCAEWATECLRVLKPGGHLLAFGGTRTWHRLACAVEDAGFEIRDSIAWLYGSGFDLVGPACRADSESESWDGVPYGRRTIRTGAEGRTRSLQLQVADSRSRALQGGGHPRGASTVGLSGVEAGRGAWATTAGVPETQPTSRRARRGLTRGSTCKKNRPGWQPRAGFELPSSTLRWQSARRTRTPNLKSRLPL